VLFQNSPVRGFGDLAFSAIAAMNVNMADIPTVAIAVLTVASETLEKSCSVR